MAGQNNITHDGTYLGRMEGGDRIYCQILLIKDYLKGVLSKHLWLV